MRRSRHRIVALSLGNDTVASSRVRVGAALKSLEECGWKTARVTARWKSWPLVLLALLLWHRPDVTLVQKVVPPPGLARLISHLSSRIVFDCDDAIQLGYNLQSQVAATTSERLKVMLPFCHLTIVSNEVLESDFRVLGATSLVVFPGPAPEVSTSRPDGLRSGILWLGSPSTIESVRSVVYPAMRLLGDGQLLTVVGAEVDVARELAEEQVWSLEREKYALTYARVGLAPQLRSEWNRRKAFYKVFEYLAAEVIPVVPDDPAINLMLGPHAGTLAVVVGGDTPEYWADGISRALVKPVDNAWRVARQLVFERWSARRLAAVIAGR